MRRWLALLIGLAAVTVAGTALALTGSEGGGEEKAVTETTIEVEPTTTTTTATLEEPIELKLIRPGVYGVDESDEPQVVEDVIPPSVVILHPEDGQVFERAEIVLEGTSEPGARVFASDREAEMRDDGSWRLVLHLDKGENLITVKAVDSAENHAADSVTVFYQPPEKVEEPQEKPKEEPKDEKSEERPKDEKPKEEPREEEPKEEHPTEEPKEHEWEFSAHQVYGECAETPPYDVFHGTAKPGTVIHVSSEFGAGEAEVGEHGGWEIKVIFEGAPVGEAFAVKVKDEFGNHKVFEFVRVG